MIVAAELYGYFIFITKQSFVIKIIERDVYLKVLFEII